MTSVVKKTMGKVKIAVDKCVPKIKGINLIPKVLEAISEVMYKLRAIRIFFSIVFCKLFFLINSLKGQNRGYILVVFLCGNCEEYGGVCGWDCVGRGFDHGSRR